MAIGRPYAFEEEQHVSGEITQRLVPFEQIARGDAAPRSEASMRQHYTLSGALAAGDPLRIVADRPVVIRAPLPFTKYGVLIFDAVTGYIGLGRQAAASPGMYDDRHPGSGLREDRTTATELISIVFTVVPANPVEVFVYAGEAARPV